ncbi:hypothetical protein SRABI89_00113 [Pseudomonas koreensis]|nr:hypothetical protein SRABI89_00113 [Pseudomonas koreensis]
MLENERLIKEILTGFSTYQHYVNFCGKTGNLDTNKAAEGFVAPLLNTLFEWDLKLVGAANYPGIDLIDPTKKIGVQVSSDPSSGKVNKTLEVIVTSNLKQSIGSLYFFFLQPKQKTYKLKLSCLGVAFDTKQHIMDFDSLIEKLNTRNLSDLQKSASIVKSFLPHLYQEKAAFLKQSQKELKENLTYLDRAVFHQLERHEEPFAMLSAIRDIRISLQRNGSKLVSNAVAAEEFANICKTLQNCENSVREDFPTLWDCASRGCRPTAEEHEKGEFWKTFSIMMEIRDPIAASAGRIRDELVRINMELHQ